MKAIQRDSVVDRAEHALREGLRAGQWAERLPGVRVLSRVLGVSPPTVSAAVARLVDDGWLQHDGARKRMRVDLERLRENVRRRPQQQRLVFFTPEEVSTAVHSALIVLTELLAELSSEGWDVRHRAMPYGHSEAAWKRWDRCLETDKPDFLVAWSARPALCDWAVSRGLKMALFGGVQGEVPLPMLGVRTSRMVERAMDELLHRGHRSVILPMWNRPQAFRDRLRQVMGVKLGEAGVTLNAAFHTPESPHDTPVVIYDTMADIWDRGDPTALVLLDWREFVAASCFLRDRGIAIPRDLSVVVLSHQPTMDCHLPSLAHFEHPVKRMAKTLADWARVYPGKAVEKFFEPRWVDGESVAPARTTVA